MTYYIGNGWSPERRAKQAERCRKNKPWQHTTGPTSEKGKSKSKYNAIKHGMRSAEAEELRHLMWLQRRYVFTLLKKLGGNKRCGAP